MPILELLALVINVNFEVEVELIRLTVPVILRQIHVESFSPEFEAFRSEYLLVSESPLQESNIFHDPTHKIIKTEISYLLPPGYLQEGRRKDTVGDNFAFVFCECWWKHNWLGWTRLSLP